MRQRWTPFHVSRFGEPIQHVSLQDVLNTGIKHGSLPGCIPIFYEVEACNEANYEYFGSWQQLEAWQQAKIIAEYFLKRLIQQHEQDAQVAEQKRQARRKK